MKKSTIYKLAQYAVLNDGRIPDSSKMEILIELESERKFAEFVEEEQKKAQEETTENDADRK